MTTQAADPADRCFVCTARDVAVASIADAEATPCSSCLDCLVNVKESAWSDVNFYTIKEFKKCKALLDTDTVTFPFQTEEQWRTRLIGSAGATSGTEKDPVDVCAAACNKS